VTIQEVLEQAQSERRQLQRTRDAARAEVREIIAKAAKAGRSNLTQAEDERVSKLLAERDQASEDLAKVDRKIEELRDAAVDEAQAQALSGVSFPTAAADRSAGGDRTIRVGAEERTYRPDHDPHGRQFILDVVRSRFDGNTDASARLTRHMAEERVERGQYLERAVGTGAFTGLVVPQYLTDMYAPATANLRPLVDVANKHNLPPDGMTVNISRITTPTAVGLQATENTAVTEQNIDDTILTENVQTAAGQQTVSRQALERGTLTEDVVLQDLFNRYATQVDSTLINQAATGLSVNTALNTYTSASPTAAELWPFFHKASSLGEQAFLNMAPITHVVMHTRRWNWAQSNVGSTWPFMGVGGIPPQQGALIVPGEYGTGAVRGVLSNGLKVLVDNNVPTTTGGTQDEIYVVAASEIHVWEDARAPVFIRADQALAASLGVLLVLYGYFAYSVRRYGATAHQRIVGTGTAAPAGF
jgi:HK97 family phage major capsid protein